MSLRFRLIISIGFGLIASVTFGGAFALWDAAHQVQTEMRSAIAGADRIAQTAIADSSHSARQAERLQHLIREFDGNRHVQATVIGRDGRVVLASMLEASNTHIPGWFSRLLDGGPKVVRINLSPESDEYEALVLTTDAANELAEKWGDIGLALSVLVAFCTVVLGIVYWTLARGLRPLQALNVAFDRVGRGDYSPRVAENGPTELARLAHEFNQMVTRLSAMQHQNARLNEQLANVQEEERSELARELHDEIGPFLLAVGLDVSAIHKAINANDHVSAQLSPRLEAIRAATTHMRKHLKIILGRLRPSVLLDLGLAQAIDNLVDFWRGRNPQVVFDLKVFPESFGEPLDEGIYRIVRESLNNALRHGQPSEVDINIRFETDGTVAIDVVDDGGGMKAANTAIGFGIIGMQERIALLGGTISIGNRDDAKGVIVSARLPSQKASGSLARETERSVSA